MKHRELKRLLVNPPVLKAPTPDGYLDWKVTHLERCRWHSITEARE